jgi:hypothetical protein
MNDYTLSPWQKNVLWDLENMANTKLPQWHIGLANPLGIKGRRIFLKRINKSLHKLPKGFEYELTVCFISAGIPDEYSNYDGHGRPKFGFQKDNDTQVWVPLMFLTEDLRKEMIKDGVRDTELEKLSIGDLVDEEWVNIMDIVRIVIKPKKI